jgi:small GTP-binding protein
MGGPHDETFEIFLLGDKETGKTAFQSVFFRGVDFREVYVATIGMDYAAKCVRLSNRIRMSKLQCWDMAGQERFRSIVPSRIERANAVILTFDLSDKQSLQSLESNFLGLLQENCKSDTLERIVLMGTKSDLIKNPNNRLVKTKALVKVPVKPQEITKFKQTIATELKDLGITEDKIDYIETSAKHRTIDRKSGKNLEETEKLSGDNFFKDLANKLIIAESQKIQKLEPDIGSEQENSQRDGLAEYVRFISALLVVGCVAILGMGTGIGMCVGHEFPHHVRRHDPMFNNSLKSLKPAGAGAVLGVTYTAIAIGVVCLLAAIVIGCNKKTAASLEQGFGIGNKLSN